MAVLLTAVALIGGPDTLESAPASAQAGIGSAAAQPRHDRVCDDARARHRIADQATPHRGIAERGGPSRHCQPALPPSSSQSHVPTSARLATGAASRRPVPASTGGVRRAWHAGTCSPESLQIFRC